MGISGVFDGNGRVISLSGPNWHDAKAIATTVTATVPIDHRESIYARVGDWLPVGCSALVVLGLLTSFVQRKDRSIKEIA